MLKRKLGSQGLKIPDYLEQTHQAYVIEMHIPVGMKSHGIQQRNPVTMLLLAFIERHGMELCSATEQHLAQEVSEGVAARHRPWVWTSHPRLCPRRR